MAGNLGQAEVAPPETDMFGSDAPPRSAAASRFARSHYQPALGVLHGLTPQAGLYGERTAQLMGGLQTRHTSRSATELAATAAAAAAAAAAALPSTTTVAAAAASSTAEGGGAVASGGGCGWPGGDAGWRDGGDDGSVGDGG